MNIRITLIRNLLSQVWSRLFSNIGVRLLQVPILLAALGQDDYGRWLVLSTIPAWLSLSNMGYGTVAGNEMVMNMGGGDLTKARQTYSNTFFLAAVSGMVIFPLVMLGTYHAPLAGWLGVPKERSTEISLAAFLLSFSVILSFFADVFGTRLRAARKTHLVGILLGLQLWLELGLILFMLKSGSRFDLLALANLLSTCAYLLVVYIFSRRTMPGIRFRQKDISLPVVRQLFTNGFYYQALPLGHAMLLQGQVMLVQSVLGPAAVALFSTSRTLVRLISQGLELINHSVWPELSLLFGKRDHQKAAMLHRTSVFLSVSLALTAALIFSLGGTWLFQQWTRQLLPISQSLLIAFLVAVPANALWYTSSIVLLSANEYEGLARRYVIAAVLSLAACYLLTQQFGLEGAALATLVADLVMIPFVMKRSLQLTQDRFPGISRRLRSDLLAAFRSRQPVI